MLESQKVQLVDVISGACQQVELLYSLQKSLSIETIEKVIQLQWHNKCGEIKLSLHNLVETTSLPELDSQLNKFVATDTVAALSRVGTSLYVRLQSVAMLMLALRVKQSLIHPVDTCQSKEAPTLALSVLEWPVASMTAFTPVVDAPIRAQLIAQSIVNMMRSNGTRVHWLLLLPASPTDNISLVMRHLKSIGLEPDEIRVASLDEQAALKRQLQILDIATINSENNTCLLDLISFGANRLLLPLVSDVHDSTGLLLDMAAALLRTTSENNDNPTKLLVIAPETYQMRIQQVHALLKVLSARDRLLYTQIDLEYIPVGPIQYRKKVVDYSIDKSIAYIQSTMQRMSANRLTDDDVDRVNRSSTKLNENTKCHLLDSTIVNTTTAATFAGLFMETKRQKYIRLLEDLPELLLEKGQPMVYILYTRAKLCAILDAHSVDYSFDSSLLTDADYKTYAHHLSTAHAAVEVAREIIDYEQVAKVALERREPCLLVAFAVRLSRATMKVCDALRVKNYSAHIAFPRVYLLSTCELILRNTIYQLGISPLERM